GYGNDNVQGNKGRDRIFGGFGNDTIHGGKGWDLLVGGYGQDYLNGGKGWDRIIQDNDDQLSTLPVGSGMVLKHISAR
ncbi:MAG: hypothetical protein ABW125_02480, partial [Candidatus Thiodiazotropha lotti]